MANFSAEILQSCPIHHCDINVCQKCCTGTMYLVVHFRSSLEQQLVSSQKGRVQGSSRPGFEDMFCWILQGCWWITLYALPPPSKQTHRVLFSVGTLHRGSRQRKGLSGHSGQLPFCQSTNRWWPLFTCGLMSLSPQPAGTQCFSAHNQVANPQASGSWGTCMPSLSSRIPAPLSTQALWGRITN